MFAGSNSVPDPGRCLEDNDCQDPPGFLCDLVDGLCKPGNILMEYPTPTPPVIFTRVGASDVIASKKVEIIAFIF